jgi:hypothetical protein
MSVQVVKIVTDPNRKGRDKNSVWTGRFFEIELKEMHGTEFDKNLER